MAKPNYSFEKRQRELAKKKKKEEKLKEKAVRKLNPDGTVQEGDADGDTDGEPNVEAGAPPAEGQVAG